MMGENVHNVIHILLINQRIKSVYSQRKQYQYSKKSERFQCVSGCYPHFHYFLSRFIYNPAFCLYVVHNSTKAGDFDDRLFTNTGFAEMSGFAAGCGLILTLVGADG